MFSRQSRNNLSKAEISAPCQRYQKQLNSLFKGRRLNAVYALARFQTAEANEILAERLKIEKVPEIWQAIAQGIRGDLSAQTLVILRSILPSEETQSIQAARILSGSTDREVVFDLMKVVLERPLSTHDKLATVCPGSPAIKYAAEALRDSITKMHGSDLQNEVEAKLSKVLNPKDTPYAYRRLCIVIALQYCKTETAHAALQKTFESDPVNQVRRAAQDIIMKLQS